MIPLSAPDICESDFQLVHDVLQSRYLASGDVARQFEDEVAARFGARFALAVSSGTAALHLAVIAAGVEARDLVITTPYSFVASSNVILYERGIPVFVDVDPATLAIDPGRTVEAIRTISERRAGWDTLLPPAMRGSEAGSLRAVLPVDLFGCPAELDEIAAAARETGIAVIEDACEALGATADGKYAGCRGDAGTFGFYPNKQITSGEGGMLLTDREDWAELFRSLRNQGRSNDASWLRHVSLGFNYRMDEMSAALGLAQFRRMEALLARRADVARRYTARLASIPGLSPLPSMRAGATRTWFLYSLRLAPELDRDAIVRGLERRGVMSRPYFWPIHLQPYYTERFGFTAGAFPIAEAAGNSMLSLPMSPNLTDETIDYVCDALAREVAAA